MSQATSDQVDRHDEGRHACLERAADPANGFLQYIYHTDKEDLDPVLYDGGNATIEAKCNQYYYQRRPVKPGSPARVLARTRARRSRSAPAT